MKPQDFTRFAPDNEEKWLYKDITEKIIGATIDEAQLLNFKLLNYLKATKKQGWFATKFRQGEFRD